MISFIIWRWTIIFSAITKIYQIRQQWCIIIIYYHFILHTIWSCTKEYPKATKLMMWAEFLQNHVVALGAYRDTIPETVNQVSLLKKVLFGRVNFFETVVLCAGRLSTYGLSWTGRGPVLNGRFRDEKDGCQIHETMFTKFSTTMLLNRLNCWLLNKNNGAWKQAFLRKKSSKMG